MAKQHDLIINRLLANYLERELDPESIEYCESDISKVFGVMCLAEKDRSEIVKSAKKRMKYLKRVSKPLGPSIRNWFNELKGDKS